MVICNNNKIHISFTFLVLAHPGSPGKRAVKRVCVCVCVRVGVSGENHAVQTLLFVNGCDM